MSYTHYERLSGLDTTFLEVEDGSCHMHIGAVAIFEAGPLRRADGGLDVDGIRAITEATLHRVPRYRQKITRVPVLGDAVWVDDPRFNLQYHVRHTHLPPPGDDRLLKRLAGRIMSQQLDRGKPLWEMWIVEGLEGDRFAFITKMHHCMIDGVGGVELTGAVMRTDAQPDPRLDQPPPTWAPRPAPSGAALLGGELGRRARQPLRLAAGATRALASPRRALASAYDTIEGVGEAVVAGLRPTAATPLNVEIGPHRRFDWLTVDLGEVKRVGKRLGGTVNDVVLTTVSGALRRFLIHRGVDKPPADFRTMIPVNVRRNDDRRDLGNRVAMLVARLPLEVHDARERFGLVHAETSELKHSRQAQGVQALEDLSDVTFTTFFAWFTRLAATSRPYNLVVTNVPGPQFPVYVLGCRMTACYPVVPLFREQALGIALLSYDGTLHWGFNADWDVLSDLHELVELTAAEFGRLATLAGEGVADAGVSGSPS